MTASEQNSKRQCKTNGVLCSETKQSINILTKCKKIKKHKLVCGNV